MKKCILVFLVSLFPLWGLGGLFGVGLSAQVINKTIYNCAAFTIPEAAAASPAPSAYRWFENGTEIEGATTTTYTIVKDKPAGTYTYVRQAFSTNCQLWQSSNAYTVAVMASGIPGQPTTPTGVDVNGCAETSVRLTTTAVAGAASYVWYKGGVAAATTTALSYDVSSVGTNNYTVAGLNACGVAGVQSAAKQVTVIAAPTASVTALSINCGDAATMSATVNAGSGSISSIRWYLGGVDQGTTTATTKTTAALTATTSYYVTATNSNGCVVTSAPQTITVGSCGQSPGSTATFATFNPTNYTTNSTWVLTDDRSGAGNQTYTVRYLADGRFWMVNDMKYPTACNKTAFTGSTTATTSTMNKGRTGVVGLEDFYGDCRNTGTYTANNVGYLYDWSFVMQTPEAAYGKTWDPGCTGNASNTAACRGICPAGWHVPTGNATTGEFTLLNTAVNGGSTSSPAGLLNTATFNGVYGGNCINTGTLNNQGSLAYYWSSSWNSNNFAYALYFYSSLVNPAYSNYNYAKNYGSTLRCVRNY